MEEEVHELLIDKEFENKDIKKIGYKMKADYILLKEQDIELNNLHFDVEVAGYLLDSSIGKYSLESLAEKTANNVIKTGKSITLEPMQAYERKIIHSKLQNNHKVKTHSVGEEPYRKIIISLSKKEV